MLLHLRCLLLCLPAFLLAAADVPVTVESDGLVIIECESTQSPPGEWELRTDIADHSGPGHLVFTGNREKSGGKKSPLVYRFKITEAGTYRLLIRAGRVAPAGTPRDQANDCYVKVSGDYAAGGKAPLSILQSDTKFFGAKQDSWSRWSERLDHKHQKYPAEYAFKAGKTYELTIHGRSRSYAMDRIVFFKTDAHSAKAAKRATAP